MRSAGEADKEDEDKDVTNCDIYDDWNKPGRLPKPLRMGLKLRFEYLQLPVSADIE